MAARAGINYCRLSYCNVGKVSPSGVGAWEQVTCTGQRVSEEKTHLQKWLHFRNHYAITLCLKISSLGGVMLQKSLETLLKFLNDARATPMMKRQKPESVRGAAKILRFSQNLTVPPCSLLLESEINCGPFCS